MPRNHSGIEPESPEQKQPDKNYFTLSLWLTVGIFGGICAVLLIYFWVSLAGADESGKAVFCISRCICALRSLLS